jgi:hypothetical protein
VFLVQVLVGGTERIVRCRSVTTDAAGRLVLVEPLAEVEIVHDGAPFRVKTWAVPQAFVGWYAEVDPPQP